MTPSFRIFFMSLLVVAGSTGSPEVCMAAINMPKGEVEIRQPAVKLSDVFSGVAVADDDEIAQAPAPCRQETYDVNVLTRLANKYHLDWKARSLADHVVVSTACTRLSADTIADAIRKAVRDNRTGSTDKGSIEVAFDNHALEIDLPADQASNFTLNNFTYDAVSKYFHADVVTQIQSGPFAVPVSGRVMIKRSVPVLTHRLEGGTVIAASDIDWMDVSEDRVNPSVIMNADQLVGHELRRDTEGGEVLHGHDVMAPKLVARGKLVTLQIETPFMNLSAQGKALQDGSAGDVVRVLNLQSDRVIEGIAESDGVVRVLSTQKVAEAHAEE